MAQGGEVTRQGKDTPLQLSPPALPGLPPVSHSDATVCEELEMGLRLELKPGRLCPEATAALCSPSQPG